MPSLIPCRQLSTLLLCTRQLCKKTVADNQRYFGIQHSCIIAVLTAPVIHVQRVSPKMVRVYSALFLTHSCFHARFAVSILHSQGRSVLERYLFSLNVVVINYVHYILHGCCLYLLFAGEAVLLRDPARLGVRLTLAMVLCYVSVCCCRGLCWRNRKVYIDWERQ